MKPSSVFVLAAAIMFLAAALALVFEENASRALGAAYTALFVANVGFALL